MADPSPDLDPRVAMAAERTLLAWMRTGIALMGFGFIVARFGVDAGQKNGPTLGAALVGAGIALNLWASARHVQILKRLHAGEQNVIKAAGPVTIVLATCLAGVVLFFVVIATR